MNEIDRRSSILRLIMDTSCGSISINGTGINMFFLADRLELEKYHHTQDGDGSVGTWIEARGVFIRSVPVDFSHHDTKFFNMGIARFTEGLQQSAGICQGRTLKIPCPLPAARENITH